MLEVKLRRMERIRRRLERKSFKMFLLSWAGVHD